MLITVNGLVIGRRAVGDSNCFLDILTAEYGVIEVFAHSVKKLTSKNAGSTSLFSYSEFCLNISGTRRRQELPPTINSSSPKFNFHKLSHDIFSLSLAAYFAEVVKHTTPEHLGVKTYTPGGGENILDLFLITLYELQRENAAHRTVKAIFEFKLAALLGFMPDLRACEACACYESDILYFMPESGNMYCKDCYNDRDLYARAAFEIDKILLYVLRYIIYSGLKKIYKFSVSEKYINELSVIAEKYLLLHIDKNFKTLDYFKSL